MDQADMRFQQLLQNDLLAAFQRLTSEQKSALLASPEPFIVGAKNLLHNCADAAAHVSAVAQQCDLDNPVDQG